MPCSQERPDAFFDVIGLPLCGEAALGSRGRTRPRDAAFFLASALARGMPESEKQSGWPLRAMGNPSPSTAGKSACCGVSYNPSTSIDLTHITPATWKGTEIRLDALLPSKNVREEAVRVSAEGIFGRRVRFVCGDAPIVEHKKSRSETGNGKITRRSAECSNLYKFVANVLRGQPAACLAPCTPLPCPGAHSPDHFIRPQFCLWL
jgi:hypothetical protein